MDIFSRITQRIHLNLPNFFHPQLRESSEGLVPQEAEIFKGHNFGNSSSLSNLKLTCGSSRVLLPIGMSQFHFGSIDLCSTVEVYSRILGDPYDTDSIVTPPFNQGFKLWRSKGLGIKKNVLEKGDDKNECSFNLLCNLFAK